MSKIIQNIKKNAMPQIAQIALEQTETKIRNILANQLTQAQQAIITGQRSGTGNKGLLNFDVMQYFSAQIIWDQSGGFTISYRLNLPDTIEIDSYQQSTIDMCIYNATTRFKF